MLQQTFVPKALSTSFYYFNLIFGFKILRKVEADFIESG